MFFIPARIVSLSFILTFPCCPCFKCWRQHSSTFSIAKLHGKFSSYDKFAMTGRKLNLPKIIISNNFHVYVRTYQTKFCTLESLYLLFFIRIFLYIIPVTFLSVEACEHCPYAWKLSIQNFKITLEFYLCLRPSSWDRRRMRPGLDTALCWRLSSS